MANEMDERVEVKLIGIDYLPADGREWSAVKRVQFVVEVDGRRHDHQRAPGFVITVPVSADFFDDADLISIARGRAHDILRTAADLTVGWSMTNEQIQGKRLPSSRPDK